MPRYIFRFTGHGPKPEPDVARITSARTARVIDAESSRMLLVEIAADQVPVVLAGLSDWVASPEQMVDLPDPRYAVEGPPASTEERSG